MSRRAIDELRDALAADSELAVVDTGRLLHRISQLAEIVAARPEPVSKPAAAPKAKGKR
jgi:hypothetical protein